MKFELKEPKNLDNPHARPDMWWKSCLPFLENSRAVLIHRPVRVSVHKGFGYTWLGVGNYCGNHFTGAKNLTFLSEVPEGKIVCARCEFEAVKAGLPSSDELMGKHVHIGGVKAFISCCKDKP